MCHINSEKIEEITGEQLKLQRVFIFNRYIEAIGYKKLKLPGQKYIQHHEVKYPNHIGHLGQTITNHTWVLHEEPLEHDQNSLCYQEFQLMVTVHRADKIFLTQPKNKRTRHRHNDW